MKISIHDNDTTITGTYKILFSVKGENKCVIISESETNSLLDMRQKEEFFMGDRTFNINSEYDINLLISKSL